MKTVTQKQLMGAKRQTVYMYESPDTFFQTQTCALAPGLTLTYERRKGTTKFKSTYAFAGKRTDSIIQAIRWYNEEARKEVEPGRPLAGSPKQASGAVVK